MMTFFFFWPKHNFNQSLNCVVYKRTRSVSAVARGAGSARSGGICSGALRRGARMRRILPAFGQRRPGALSLPAFQRRVSPAASPAGSAAGWASLRGWHPAAPCCGCSHGFWGGSVTVPAPSRASEAKCVHSVKCFYRVHRNPAQTFPPTGMGRGTSQHQREGFVLRRESPKSQQLAPVPAAGAELALAALGLGPGRFPTAPPRPSEGPRDPRARLCGAGLESGVSASRGSRFAAGGGAPRGDGASPGPGRFGPFLG